MIVCNRCQKIGLNAPHVVHLDRSTQHAYCGDVQTEHLHLCDYCLDAVGRFANTPESVQTGWVHDEADGWEIVTIKKGNGRWIRIERTPVTREIYEVFRADSQDYYSATYRPGEPMGDAIIKDFNRIVAAIQARKPATSEATKDTSDLCPNCGRYSVNLFAVCPYCGQFNRRADAIHITNPDCSEVTDEELHEAIHGPAPDDFHKNVARIRNLALNTGGWVISDRFEDGQSCELLRLDDGYSIIIDKERVILYGHVDTVHSRHAFDGQLLAEWFFAKAAAIKEKAVIPKPGDHVADVGGKVQEMQPGLREYQNRNERQARTIDSYRKAISVLIGKDPFENYEGLFDPKSMPGYAAALERLSRSDTPAAPGKPIDEPAQPAPVATAGEWNGWTYTQDDSGNHFVSHKDGSEFCWFEDHHRHEPTTLRMACTIRDAILAQTIDPTEKASQ